METSSNEARTDAPVTEPVFSGFTMRSGNTSFVVGLHFSETSKETFEDKVKRLVKKEADSVSG